jgi:hypothetical protein
LAASAFGFFAADFFAAGFFAAGFFAAGLVDSFEAAAVCADTSGVATIMLAPNKISEGRNCFIDLSPIMCKVPL